MDKYINQQKIGGPDGILEIQGNRQAAGLPA